MLEAQDVIYPQFATHNAGTIAAILQMAARTGASFELQRLHGMGEGIYGEVLRNPLIACRVYAPVGQHRDLLAYLVRRLLENGANNSFVHQLADESVGMDQLLLSPLRLQATPSLPLPPDLYGAQRAEQHGRRLDGGGHARPAAGGLRHGSGPVRRGFRYGPRGRGGRPFLESIPGMARDTGGRARRHAASRGRRHGNADAQPVRAPREGSLQDLGRLRVRGARGSRLPALLRQ